MSGNFREMPESTLMRKFDVQINQKQAKQLASAIYSDIAEYIAEHQMEYREFLQNEYDKKVRQ